MALQSASLVVAVALTAAFSAPAEATIISGLQAYYSFNGNANDQFGSFNGTVNGATTTTGLLGGAYDFQGNANIAIGTPLPLTNGARSFSMWVKPGSNAAGQQLSLFEGGNGATGQDFDVWLQSGSGFGGSDSTIYIRRNVNDVVTTPSLTINQGAWNHIVISYDGSNEHNIQIYVNGALGAINTGFTGFSTFNTQATAQFIGHGGQPTNESIDEVGIWNRALTAAEVTTLYNNGAGFNPLAVPEPVTAALLSLGGLVASRARRRQPGA